MVSDEECPLTLVGMVTSRASEAANVDGGGMNGGTGGNG